VGVMDMNMIVNIIVVRFAKIAFVANRADIIIQEQEKELI